MKNKMQRTGLILLLLSILCVGCSSKNVSKQNKGTLEEITYYQISQEEAKEIMDTEEDYIILDVRTQEEYAEGHIKDAVCLPNETIGEEEISLLPHKDQKILVYCRSGNRSKQAAEKLVGLGYSQVYEFGGIKDWKYDIVK